MAQHRTPQHTTAHHNTQQHARAQQGMAWHGKGQEVTHFAMNTSNCTRIIPQNPSLNKCSIKMKNKVDKLQATNDTKKFEFQVQVPVQIHLSDIQKKHEYSGM